MLTPNAYTTIIHLALFRQT